MAVELKDVTEVGTEPGTLPETMAAWVIRQEREGEPRDAFQIEEIEVPEPGAFEVIVRVMAAGVNYNNVWAALGKPVSVFRYHPEEDHHHGGWDAAGRLGVFATQLCKAAGAQSVGVVSSEEKGKLVEQLGGTGWINRNEYAGMMRKGGETPDEEKARFAESRKFDKAVKEILGD